MTVTTRTIIAIVTVATGVVLVSSTASADQRSDCSEARAFLRSEEAHRACSSRYRSARSLFCSSATSQRLLLSMARSCKARGVSPHASAGSPAAADSSKKAPEKSAEPVVASGVDSIPVCKAYFARLAACPGGKAGTTRQEEANLKRRELQEKLNKGTRVELIGGSCQVMDKVLKC